MHKLFTLYIQYSMKNYMIPYIFNFPFKTFYTENLILYELIPNGQTLYSIYRFLYGKINTLHTYYSMDTSENEILAFSLS